MSSRLTRIVLSRRLDLPLEGKLAQSAREVPLWLIHGPDAAPATRLAWEATGARLFEVGAAGREVDLSMALSAMAEAGLTRIFCEGGGSLAAALLSGGYADALVGFTAGMVLGAEGTPCVGAMGIDQLADAPRYRLIDSHAIGGDVMTYWRQIQD